MFLTPTFQLGRIQRLSYKEMMVFMVNIIKQEYDPEIKEKERKKLELRKISNLFNNKEINRSLKHINYEMEKSAEEFYTKKKDKEKGGGLSI